MSSLNPMRFLLPLLAAGALVLSACDGTDPVAMVSGPIVEFASSSTNVSEADGTVEIPVRLRNGDGGSVTVEVLYAAATSTAKYGDDVTGFGTEAGSNRVATVTLSGTTDTKTVTIDIMPDDEAESAEAAVFVLQRATGGAQIGDNREFRLEIGTPPISAARERAIGETVTVEGIVTSAQNRYTFIQDDSAGLTIYEFEDQLFGMAVSSGAVRVGDRVQVVGTMDAFNDLLEIVDVTAFEVLSRDNPLPDAPTLTVAQLLSSGDEYESEIVRIENLTVTDPVGAFLFQRGNQTVSDGTGSIVLRTQFGSKLSDQEVPAGTFTFVGPIGQYQNANQLSPLSTCEIVELRGVAKDANGVVYDCTAFTR